MRWPTYYYLHENGVLIKKAAVVVDSLGADIYFEGSFVLKYWKAYSEKDVEQIEREALEIRKRRNLNIKRKP